MIPVMFQDRDYTFEIPFVFPPTAKRHSQALFVSVDMSKFFFQL